MNIKTIDDLPEANPLTGKEVIPISQDFVTSKTTIDDLLESTVKTSGNQTIEGSKKFINNIRVGRDETPRVAGRIDILGIAPSVLITQGGSSGIFTQGMDLLTLGSGIRIADRRIVLRDSSNNPIPIKNLATPVDPNDAANKEYVDSRVPLSTTPHLWPSDGSEVDLGDGTFGKRFAGTDTSPTIEIFGGIFTTLKILSAGGNWTLYNEVTGSTDMYLFTNGSSGSRAPWSQVSAVLDLTNRWTLYLILYTNSLMMQVDVNYDIWVRYTK